MSNIDYTKSILHFTAFRRHFFKNVQYHVHIFDDFLVMGRQKEDSKPKYRILFSLQIQIQFQLDINTKKGIKYLAFAFKYKQQYKEMFAEHDEVQKMKNMICNKVTFFKIADFYEPQYIIGKGSSARVLLVQKLYENKQYAVKSIDKAYLFKSDNGLEAFQSEVKILTLLSHTNTENQKLFLKLYEIFEGELTYYLIVELMQGRTLQDELDTLKQLNNGGIMKQEETFIIMRKLLEGVTIMHQNNIIHRDLKPDNIMFALPKDYSTLRIVDFGLATETSVQKYMFPKCGTPGYVAPEVLNLSNRSEKYSAVCDLFSCGCIFYKLLTGRSLFQGTQFNEVLKLNKACDIDLQTNLELMNVNQDAYNLLTQLLQKDPLLRITAEESLQHPYLQDMKNNSTQNLYFNSDQQLQLNRSLNNQFVGDKEIVTNQETDEVISPFQKRALIIQKSELKLQKVEEEHKAEEDSNNQENLSDQVMQEFQCVDGLKIQQLPMFKKPGGLIHRRSQQLIKQQFSEFQSQNQKDLKLNVGFKSEQVSLNEIDKFKQFEEIHVDSYIPVMQKSQSLSPNQRKSIKQTSVSSFYMKEPLSALKKHQYKKDSKKNTYIFQQPDIPEDVGKSMGQSLFMDKLSLFNRNPQQNENR